MESLDLHPEELFDKAARGAASADELARLDTHLASCAACRFERQVRADFAAVNDSAADLDDLVARALSGAAQAQPESQSTQGPQRRRRFSPLLVAAIALIGAASFGAVAQFTGVLPRLITQLSTAPAVVPEPAPAPKHRAAPKLPERAPEVSEAALEPEVELDVPAPKLEPVVVAVAPRPNRVAPVSPPAPRRELAVESTPDLPPPPLVVAAEPDALSLFSQAQRARVGGDLSAAIRDFRVVVARYPNAPEAALAHAELGRLLLDRGEAASALEAFDAYLASRDPALREDVQGARAMALMALGRTDAERSAWEAVLRDYPSGVYAPRARTRLESLSP